MKRIKSLWALLLAAVAAVTALGLSSCDKDIETDVCPVCLWVYIVDSEGNNLLAPENPDNLVGKLNCMITYKDRSHQIFWYIPSVEDRWPWLDLNDFTRYYATIFYGVWYDIYTHSERHLTVGEFDGDSSWTEYFTLEFPDYNKKYDFEMKYKGYGNKPTLKVNGEKVKVKARDPEYTIVLP